MRDIDAHYYGFRDDDDGKLVGLELEAEKQAVAAALKEWKAKRAGESGGMRLKLAVDHNQKRQVKLRLQQPPAT